MFYQSFYLRLKEPFYFISKILKMNNDDSAKKIEERWLKNSTCK